MFGDRLHLIEASAARLLSIEPVGLLIADLVVEDVGHDEFVGLAAANATNIGVLSCVTQHSGSAGFVSSSSDAATFAPSSSVSSEIDPGELSSALAGVGYSRRLQRDSVLPDGKHFVRQDFPPAVRADAG